ncbi:F0F1 ATP synthase subunit B family protein [Parapedomonas caeni]
MSNTASDIMASGSPMDTDTPALHDMANMPAVGEAPVTTSPDLDAPAIPGESHGDAAAEAHTEAADAHGEAAHHDTFLALDATGWVAVGMLLFIGVLLWKKVPAAIGKALDGQIAGIRSQLDQAERLRAEAEALKAEQERKKAEADALAVEIVANARNEASGIIADARAKAEALAARRREVAESKIAAAERAAIDEIRETAASIGAEAARKLIAEKLSDAGRAQLVDTAIADVGQRLH